MNEAYRDRLHHFVRDAFQEGFLASSYICSELQPTDVLTKALNPTQFHH